MRWNEHTGEVEYLDDDFRAEVAEAFHKTPEQLTPAEIRCLIRQQTKKIVRLHVELAGLNSPDAAIFLRELANELEAGLIPA